MRFLRFFSMTAAAALVSVSAARADVNVVASIKPIHGMVTAVMGDSGTPTLLMDAQGSPHNYALRPSQARALQNADVVFWVGPGLELFLEKPVESIAKSAEVVSLMETPDLTLLDIREGGEFEAHDHSAHGHGDHGHGHDEHAHGKKKDHDHDHDEHAHGKKKDHDHDHDEHAHGKNKDHDHDHDEHAHGKKKDHDHDHGHGHGHDHGEGAKDAHIWLDPMNAKAMVDEIAHVLGHKVPANKALYEKNAAAFKAEIDALTNDLAAKLAPVKEKGFIVFHDAYQYFENRFGLTAVGAVTVSPEVAPGADRVKTLRAKVTELGATCVFSEPQFKPRVVQVVIEGTAARAGVLDPLGVETPEGAASYPALLKDMANSLHGCLSGTS